MVTFWPLRFLILLALSLLLVTLGLRSGPRCRLQHTKCEFGLYRWAAQFCVHGISSIEVLKHPESHLP